MKRSERQDAPCMTSREVGELLGLSHRTLDRYRSTGRGSACCKFSGNAVRYRLSDVIAWAERQRRGRRK